MTLAVDAARRSRAGSRSTCGTCPQGVRVLNIGLNGVLVTEAQTERTIFLYAEPWVEPMERPFYAVGQGRRRRATEHSSPPIVDQPDSASADLAEVRPGRRAAGVGRARHGPEPESPCPSCSARDDAEIYRLSRRPSRRRGACWRSCANWNRHQVARIIAAVVLAWLVGATGIHLAERRGNPDFATWGESFWSVWVLLFSGLDQPPEDGRRAARRHGPARHRGRPGRAVHGERGVAPGRTLPAEARRVEFRDGGPPGPLQLVARAGWSGSARSTAKIIQDKRPVVIIHDDPDEIDLPDKQDDPAFNDVYIVKGDPTSEVILRRAKVPKAHSVVVLTDDREGKHADGKTILTCIAIRNICRGEQQPNIAVECRNPNNRHHLQKAGADEIISSDELGPAAPGPLGPLPRDDARLPGAADRRPRRQRDVPAAGPRGAGRQGLRRDLPACSSRYRDDRRSCLLIGIQRGEEMHLNPIGGEAGPAQAGRPAHPAEPRLPQPVPALADRPARRAGPGRDLTPGEDRDGPRQRLATPGLAAVAAVGMALGGLLVGYEPVGGRPRPDLPADQGRAGPGPARGPAALLERPLRPGRAAGGREPRRGLLPAQLVLYRLLDVAAAYRLSMWLHYPALAADDLPYARRSGLTPWGGALAAVAFTLCGFQAVHAATSGPTTPCPTCRSPCSWPSATWRPGARPGSPCWPWPTGPS